MHLFFSIFRIFPAPEYNNLYFFALLRSMCLLFACYWSVYSFPSSHFNLGDYQFIGKYYRVIGFRSFVFW